MIANLRGRSRIGFAIGMIVTGAMLVVGACSSPDPLDPNKNNPNGTGSCLAPSEGCACSSEGSTAECGEIVRKSGDFVTCSMGKRTCTGGKWGACEGDRLAFHSVGPLGMAGINTQDFTNSTKCIDDPCNPNCYTFDQDGGVTFDSGNIGISEGGITLIAADGSSCSGIACNIASCDGGMKTTITGTVTDPAGLRPINGAFVYVPNAAIQPFPNGVQMDPCGGGGTLSGNPIVVTQTAPDGTFTLTNVPFGANIPLVIQVGMWRRQVTLPNVPACQTTNANNAVMGWMNPNACTNPSTGACGHALCSQGNKLTSGCDGVQACVQKVCLNDPYCCNTFWDGICVGEVPQYCAPITCNACPPQPPANYGALHLPQDKSQGDIPLMALVTGGCDQFECLMKRIGINTNEFTTYQGAGRVHMYRGIGGYPLAGGSPFMDYLFQNQAQVDKYNIVLLPCDCGSEYGAANYNQTFNVPYSTAQNEIVAYANKGGRVFTSHWGRNWIERPNNLNQAPFPGVANWVADSTCGTYGCVDPINGYIDTSFMKGSQFSQWMLSAQVANTNPFSVTPTRIDVGSVIAPTERWVYARTDNAGSNNPDAIINMAFNTPLNAMNKYGRVAYSDTHVSSQDGFSPQQFPTICNPNNNMTPQEEALEYMFFDLSSCNTPIIVPPFAQPQTFTLDYQGVCPNMQKVVWRFFDWKAVTPLDSHIDFEAATASTQMGLAAATSVAIGSANFLQGTSTQMPPPPANWVGSDVSVALAPAKSQSWLRIKITLYPSGNMQQAPTLSSWRQLFDCVDYL